MAKGSAAEGKRDSCLPLMDEVSRCENGGSNADSFHLVHRFLLADDATVFLGARSSHLRDRSTLSRGRTFVRTPSTKSIIHPADLVGGSHSLNTTNDHSSLLIFSTLSFADSLAQYLKFYSLDSSSVTRPRIRDSSGP